MDGIFWMNVKGTYGDVQDKIFKGKKYGFLGHEIYLSTRSDSVREPSLRMT